jgi:hypothetical protein
MWLLRLHIAISILLLLTGEGTNIIFRSLIIKNGWEVSRGFKRIINFIKRFFMYFIPFINVLTTIAEFIRVFVPKEKYDD